jgi:alpha-tubulin suppressor-like RCC1 family protein
MKRVVLFPIAVALVATVSTQGAVAQGQTLTLFGKHMSNKPVSSMPGDVLQLVTTNSNTYYRLSDGSVWALGSDGEGELGNGTIASGWAKTPTRVDFPAKVTITSLATVGPDGTEMAIDSLGNVWGWGWNSFGQLCLGNKTKQLKPTKLKNLSHVSLAIGAGDHATYDANGVLYSCGGRTKGDVGELGDGKFASTLSPKQVVDLPSGSITALTAGWGTTGAVINGSLWVWGYNANGQLGIPNGDTNSDVPVQVQLQAAVAEVAQGGGSGSDGQTVAILTDGTTWTWGNNDWGQLCLGTTTAFYDQPQQVSGTWTAAATGGTTDYLVDAGGNLWACGDNSMGQFGTGTPGGSSSVPVSLPYASVQQISSTNFNSAVLTG